MKEKISILKKIFIESFDNESLLQVGSSVLSNNYNDIDFLVISDNIDKTKENILKKFNNYQLFQIDDAIKIVDFFETDISFAIYDKKKLFDLIEKYNSGESINCEHKTWSIGYWLIEGFIKDLKNSNVISDNHELNLIKKVISKKSIYGEKKIINDCIEEISLKKEMLKKSKSNIEIDCLKIDILFATLRALKIIDNSPMRGFKNIEKSILELSDEYRNIVDNLFIEDNIEKAIKILKKHTVDNQLYMGTWQFNGNFKKITNQNVIKLLNYAKNLGIKRFDTALVYGDAEKCIGKVIEEDDIVLTKIPAKQKPPLYDQINLYDFYDKDYIYECVSKSLNNLNREYIDIVLLHNWNDFWNNSFELIEWLNELKEKGLVKKIGISVPNGYNKQLNKKVLCYLDVIEAPYNEEDKNIENFLSIYKKYNIEIILRSLFIQGKSLKNSKDNYNKIISKAKEKRTSIVMGMTTFKQIKENITKINT